MDDHRKVRPPFACRALIRVASWIVPPRARSTWRAKWDSNLWSWWILFERGELTGRDSAELMRYSWGAFVDAFWLRISREYLRRSVRGSGFVLTAAGAVLLTMAALTHGFRGPRALFEPLPLEDPGSLVAIQYSGAMDEPFGVPPRLVPLWRAKSSLLSDLAGFMHPQRTPRAWVTTSFFSLLGVRPALGRTFRPGDGDVAVLSGAAWRSLFGRDPRVIGKTIDVDGAPHVIIGILPETFWAISRSIDIWTPLTLEPQPAPSVPFLIGAVGRLKPGASEDKVRAELFEIARNANQFLPRPPQVTSFNAVPTHPYGPYMFALLFALVSGGVLVARALPPPSGRGLRYWSFLVSKTLLLVAIPLLLWVEINGVILSSMPATLVRNMILVVLTPAFVFICAFAVWWSFADQRGRCPVCLQLLTMPVSIGSWSSVLDPATTELVCDSGHGSLSFPDVVDGQPDRWTNLDPSWIELFREKK
jgi:hypothetical protein